MQLVSGGAGTLIAAQRVDAAEFTATAVDTALVDICGHTHAVCRTPFMRSTAQ